MHTAMKTNITHALVAITGGLALAAFALFPETLNMAEEHLAQITAGGTLLAMPFLATVRRRAAPIVSKACCTERRSARFEGRDFLAIGGATDEVEAGGGITIGSDGSNFVNFPTTADPAGVSATKAFLQAAFPNAQITIVPNGNTATGEDWVVSGDTTVDWAAATSYPGVSVTGSPTGPVALSLIHI